MEDPCGGTDDAASEAGYIPADGSGTAGIASASQLVDETDNASIDIDYVR